MENPRLPEGYFVASFLSGLRDEIKPVVKMHKPSSLAEAYDIALLQEQYIDTD